MLKTNCLYLVDTNDLIIAFAGIWSSLSNQNEEMNATLPLGRPVWDFINCPTTRNIYSLLMEKIRLTKGFIKFTFRGDSAHYQRKMELQMSAGLENRIWFRTTVLDERQIAGNGKTNESQEQKRRHLIHMCAWCNFVEVDTKWVSLEQAIQDLSIFDTPHISPISHGICPDCVPLLTKHWRAAR